MNRCEELTLALVDGVITDAEADELGRLLQASPEHERVHLRLLEVEATLRAGRPHRDVAPAVVARLHATRESRVERDVMARVRVAVPPRSRGAAARGAAVAALVLIVLVVGAFAATMRGRARLPRPEPPPTPHASPTSSVPGAERPRLAARAVPALAPSADLAPFSETFEAGPDAVPLSRGVVVPAPAGRPGRFVATGAISEYEGAPLVTLQPHRYGRSLTWSDDSVLEFDVLFGDVRDACVQLWVPARRQNMKQVLGGEPGTWQHVSVRLGDLRPVRDPDDRARAGDVIENISFAGGKLGALLVDDVVMRPSP